MGGGGGDGGFEGKALYFCGGGGAVWRLAFVKMYHFLQVVVFLQNAVLRVSFVQMSSFGMKKKKKKKKTMNKQNLGSR